MKTSFIKSIKSLSILTFMITIIAILVYLDIKLMIFYQLFPFISLEHPGFSYLFYAATLLDTIYMFLHIILGPFLIIIISFLMMDFVVYTFATFVLFYEYNGFFFSSNNITPKNKNSGYASLLDRLKKTFSQNRTKIAPNQSTMKMEIEWQKQRLCCKYNPYTSIAAIRYDDKLIGWKTNLEETTHDVFSTESEAKLSVENTIFRYYKRTNKPMTLDVIWHGNYLLHLPKRFKIAYVFEGPLGWSSSLDRAAQKELYFSSALDAKRSIEKDLCLHI